LPSIALVGRIQNCFAIRHHCSDANIHKSNQIEATGLGLMIAGSNSNVKSLSMYLLCLHFLFQKSVEWAEKVAAEYTWDKDLKVGG